MSIATLSVESIALFTRLWEASPHEPTTIVIPPRSKISIHLPVPGWHYIIECLIVPAVEGAPERNILLQPYWEEKEATVETIFAEERRRMVAIHPHGRTQYLNLFELLMNASQPFPKPDDIFRWEITSPS